MDNAQVVEKVRKQFADHPWTNWSKSTAGPCLGIAFNDAVGPCIMGESVSETWNKLTAIIREQFPERVKFSPGDPYGTITTFNDHPDTVLADIDLVLDKFAAS